LKYNIDKLKAQLAALERRKAPEWEMEELQEDLSEAEMLYAGRRMYDGYFGRSQYDGGSQRRRLSSGSRSRSIAGRRAPSRSRPLRDLELRRSVLRRNLYR
jgi:hypothetical protein